MKQKNRDITREVVRKANMVHYADSIEFNVNAEIAWKVCEIDKNPCVVGDIYDKLAKILCRFGYYDIQTKKNRMKITIFRNGKNTYEPTTNQWNDIVAVFNNACDVSL